MSEDMDAAVLRLFARLPLQGPGTDADTIATLRLVEELLPDAPLVVDFGCGTGRSSLALARSLPLSSITAIDAAPTFVEVLRGEAERLGLTRRLNARVGNMLEPAIEPCSIDLVWSEGAAYFVGFEAALRAWRPVLRDTGRCVVSECEWLSTNRPSAAAAFWQTNYPQMGDRAENSRRAESAGYEVVATRILSEAGWERYHGCITEAFADEPAGAIGPEFADGIAQEIAIRRGGEGSFGYVFYVLRPR